MNRQDWVLLALFAADGYRLTPVRLQKSLFLLRERGIKESSSLDGFYEFEPYAYGPFSRQIYDDALSLADEAKVTIFPSSRASSRQYALTVSGVQAANQIASKQPRGFPYLGRAVKWTQTLSFAQLVTAIYTHFPQYRENSVF